MDEARLFGKRLRAVRKAARLTQEELAEEARLNPKYIGQLERAEKRPSFEATVSLAKALRVSPSMFFDFDSAEADEKALRRKIDVLLQKGGLQQLRQMYKLAKTILEP